MFWHKLWLSRGRLRSGAVADCMRPTRAAYHYAIRNVRRKEEEIQRERFAQCMLNNDSRNFWAEVKKIRGNRGGRSRIIDGMSNDSCIADAFVQSYKRLFTSVPYDKSDMQDLIHENCDHLTRLGYNEDYLVKIDEVRQAVSLLKAFKGDGKFELSSDHFHTCW